MLAPWFSVQASHTPRRIMRHEGPVLSRNCPKLRGPNTRNTKPRNGLETQTPEINNTLKNPELNSKSPSDLEDIRPQGCTTTQCARNPKPKPWRSLMLNPSSPNPKPLNVHSLRLSLKMLEVRLIPVFTVVSVFRSYGNQSFPRSGCL